MAEVRSLIQALQAVPLVEDVVQLLDALWLAQYFPTQHEHRVSKLQHFLPDAERSTWSPSVGSSSNAAARLPEPKITVELPSNASQTQRGFYASGGNDSLDLVERKARVVQVAGVPALRDAHLMARALRPLGKRRLSQWNTQLDEETTVDRFAQAGVLIPYFRPERERFFDALLLVEDSPTMPLWYSVTDEIEAMFARQVGFRSFRQFVMFDDSGSVQVRSRSGNISNPLHVLGGRSPLVLIVSDGTSSLWSDGRMAKSLTELGSRASLAVIQLLPERLWPNTALGSTECRVTAPRTGACNAELQCEHPDWMDAEVRHLVLPVVALQPRSMSQWAQMLMARADKYSPASVVFMGPFGDNVREATESEDIEECTPERLVALLRSVASPRVLQAAVYLSAAAPLTLAVIRLVQRVMQPNAFAEDLPLLLLSGLLVQKHGVPNRFDAQARRDDQIVFYFADGVRELLQRSLLKHDAQRVRHAVSQYIAARSGMPLSFSALLEDPKGDMVLPRWAEPFATVTQQLKKLFDESQHGKPPGKKQVEEAQLANGITIRATIRGLSEPSQVSYSPNGRRLAVRHSHGIDVFSLHVATCPVGAPLREPMLLRQKQNILFVKGWGLANTFHDDFITAAKGQLGILFQSEWETRYSSFVYSGKSEETSLQAAALARLAIKTQSIVCLIGGADFFKSPLSESIKALLLHASDAFEISSPLIQAICHDDGVGDAQPLWELQLAWSRTVATMHGTAHAAGAMMASKLREYGGNWLPEAVFGIRTKGLAWVLNEKNSLFIAPDHEHLLVTMDTVRGQLVAEDLDMLAQPLPVDANGSFSPFAIEAHPTQSIFACLCESSVHLLNSSINDSSTHKIDGKGLPSLAWSPAGDQFAIAWSDGRFYVYGSNGLPVNVLKFEFIHDRAPIIRWDYSGTKLALVLGNSGREVAILDVEKGSKSRYFILDTLIESISWSRDNVWLACGLRGGYTSLLEAKGVELLKKAEWRMPDAFMEKTTQVAFSSLPLDEEFEELAVAHGHQLQFVRVNPRALLSAVGSEKIRAANSGVAVTSSTGNVVVQIVGDGNSIVSGDPYISLTRYLGRQQIHRDLDRLSPYTRSTPLVGRSSELSSLQAFLENPRSILVRVLIGGAGSGKTRLALELCDSVSDKGWNAGFVGRTELRRFFAQQHFSNWTWNRPTLIVIDYAAEHAQLLGQWLDDLADRVDRPQVPLRLLLLERHASVETGWWTTVFASGGYGASSKRALLDPLEPMTLQPLGRSEDRLTLLKQMLGQINGGPAPGVAFEDDGVAQQLMRTAWGGDPLFVMMAALEMHRVGHANALSLSHIELAHDLAEREGGRLQELAKGRSCDPLLVQHLAACVTLAQGLDRAKFEEFANVEKVTVRRSSGGDARQLADVLQEALPRPDSDGIAPVLPDIIGEALVLRTLRWESGTSAVLRCHTAFGGPVLQSVIRCAQDFAHEEKSRAPLRWLEAIADTVRNDESGLAALDESLPMESVVLRDVNLKVAHRLDALRAAREDTPMHARASALHRLAMAQAKAGQANAAVKTEQEALAFYREIANQNPDAHQADVALSLNNLATWLSTTGQYEKALKAAQEAVDLYRALDIQRHGTFRSDLANSLNNLSNVLEFLGQRERAFEASQEAVDLCRRLVTQRPDVFEPVLALSLTNLASKFGELGQREKALQTAREATDLYRQLTAQRPDAFRPDLGLSLNNLANMMSSLGFHEAALQAVQEATEIRRELAAQQPKVFQSDLAASLNNLATIRSHLGQRENALQEAQEAVDLYRQLAAQRPEAFRTYLAISLNNLATTSSYLGLHERALQAVQEATDLYQDLAFQQPDAFLPNLARSLSNLANELSNLGRREAALHAALQAVDIQRQLASQRPDASKPDLALSLNNLANMLGDLNRRESALHAAQEATALYQELSLQQPGAFRSDLALSLCNLAINLRELGQQNAAFQAAQDSTAIYRELAAQRPDAFQPGLARSLIVLARCTFNSADSKIAPAIAREAISVLESNFLRHPGAHAELMRAALHEYLDICKSLGEKPDIQQFGPLLSRLNIEGYSPLDPSRISAIAASIVLVLTLLLRKAIWQGGEEVDHASPTSFFDKLKMRLIHAGAKEALDDLAKQPDDSDAQSSLRLQLRKSMERDPELAAFLTDWAKEFAPVVDVSQVVTVTGNRNATVQISGSGNSVG
ncbi:SAV_2336 N-terminal domain-related protein [Azohydromonas australica]|uniref:SAV_2336 N-terminal domain-related protein n=1 Tax=Azohydromonas australica TaxID=364039 RepID=UPI0012EB6D66|nr:SAV_2336 N-terminal domain-related protein [Azohydromonas australica]